MQKENIVILYGSTYGTTKKIVKKVSKDLNISTFFDVKELKDNLLLKGFELLIFFCPTYGDEELQEDMEQFLLEFKNFPKNKYFLICETGNYYGYDNFELGAKKILLDKLNKHGLNQFYRNFSLDTLPRIDYENLEKWLNGLKAIINE